MNASQDLQSDYLLVTTRRDRRMVDYSPALMTDMYEYTMLDACLKDGTADRQCVFEVFTRHLPEGRR